MATSAEHWEHVKELFSAALELRPEERRAYLHQNAKDESVCKEVERLLAEHDEAGSFLSNPVDGEIFPRQPSLAGQFTPGELLDGKFKILRLIAEGGMGQVWLAEQTIPLQRQVVVKLIKAGMYDHNSLERFRAERQSLAIMDHPCIAKVFDAGATHAGQPYFVMEYVPGLPLTKYCDEKKLSIPDRLELFIKVCEGVQHAHLKAIIHRDLKPANILIVQIDGKPTPRIIDFGIAKGTSPLGRAEFTRTGGFVGTPGYMSPEQTDPRVSDVDTRTDVYSLGAILYVLLAGSLPLDPKEWQQQPLDEMLRRLREDDPPRPSTKVSTARERVTATAEARATDAKRLVGLLRGDLDWITMKALEKDRSRRYDTPSELAADIRRHLDNEPVLARPASSGYRLRKYVRRNRIGVIVTAGISLLLIGFGVLQTVQLGRTTRERDRANRERDRASRITGFMTGMFKVSDPSEARGKSITAREVLDRAAKDIDLGLSEDPETKAQMMDAMATVYLNLGLYQQAETLSRNAVAIRQRLLGTTDPKTLASVSNLGNLLEHEGKFVEAERLCRETLATRRTVLGPRHPDTLASMNNLAILLSDQGHTVEALELIQETLKGRIEVLGPEHPNTLASMDIVGSLLETLGNFAEAEKFDRETLDGRRRVLGSQHPDTMGSMNNLASLLSREGRYPESANLFREVLATRRRVLGPEHPDTITAMNNLGAPLAMAGKFDEAEKLFRESLEIELRVLGPEHPNTISALENLALAKSSQGHYAEAETLERQAFETRKRVLGNEHPDTALSRYNLATIFVHRGKRAEAFSLLREAVEHGLPPVATMGMEDDPDLKALHGDPRFKALVADAKERAAKAGAPK